MRRWTSSPTKPRARRSHQNNGFFEREIIPVTLPDGTYVNKDDGPRATTGNSQAYIIENRVDNLLLNS